MKVYEYEYEHEHEHGLCWLIHYKANHFPGPQDY